MPLPLTDEYYTALASMIISVEREGAAILEAAAKDSISHHGYPDRLNTWREEIFLRTELVGEAAGCVGRSKKEAKLK